MKFDFVIGNPPYQENISDDENNSSLSKQLFPLFIQSAIETSNSGVVMITPSRWFAGDAQDKSFVKLREYIRNNNHISALYNYKNGKEVFPNTEIKGGVSFFAYKKEYSGQVRFVNVEHGLEKVETRNLFEEGIDIIISDSVSCAILTKVKDYKNFTSLTVMTRGRNAFGIIGKEDVVADISSEDKFDNAVQLRCKSDEIRWTARSNITKGSDILDKYKVFISKSAGSPNKDFRVIGIPYVAEKNSACTDSLIPIGNFDTIAQAENLAKYIRTKFLRYMVSIVKVSQNVTQIVYKYVPLQDFTPNSDIDWSVSVKEIDKQLYKKYGLSEEEIAFIETHVKEME